MARSGLVSTKDQGEIKFHGEIARGVVTVTIREPLSIDKRTVEMNIEDLVDICAHLTIEWIALGRQLREQYAKEGKGA
jgi:hypothetical protein